LDYLIDFEMIAEINHWDTMTMAMELATSLRDTALAVLGDVEKEEQRDYLALIKALTTRFEPTNYAEVYRAELKSRRREKDESLCVLSQDIKRLIRKAYAEDPRSTREKLAKEVFIDALDDLDMEWAIQKKAPDNINDALQFAMEFEAFRKARRHRQNDRRGLRMQSGDVQSSSQDKPASSTFWGKCFFCNNAGHRKAECRSYKSWLQRKQQCTEDSPSETAPKSSGNDQ
jgi:hypothetical protein